LPVLTHSPVERPSDRRDITLGDHLRLLAENPAVPDRPALVVQGGGLRGVYSMAALSVLEELDLRDAFSLVIGSSAGAINGAYFLAGQAQESLSIYFEELSSRRFVSPLRFWRIVDIDFLVDEVLKCRHRLDEEALRRAPASLRIVLTDARTAEARVVADPPPESDIYELFRATAALPALYNRKVKIDGSPYVDGGVADLVPVESALTDTHEAVVLLTRGAGHRTTERGVLLKTTARALSYGQSAKVRDKICRADDAYNSTMALLETEHEQRPRKTWTLRPSNVDRLVNRTTNDLKRLRDCAELARSDMLRLLGQKRLLPVPGGTPLY
jgi:predicted patatin/cPLA2 family phospholipase